MRRLGTMRRVRGGSQTGETMHQLLTAARSSAADFGGLILFYLLLWTIGLKAAILGTIVFVAIDAIRRHRSRLGFPRIYVLSSAMAVGFGLIDLASATPFMIKYEAVITSLVVGGFFFLGARGRPLLQELAEQQSGESFDDRPDVVSFFKGLTLAWGAYFVVKAAVYLWLGAILPLDRLLEIRPIVGMVSLGAMMAASWQSHRIIWLLRHIGLMRRTGRPSGNTDVAASVNAP